MAVTPRVSESLLGGREIRFLDRQESNYPHLMRLALDFGFRVLETLQVKKDQPVKSFVLVTDDYRTIDTEAISPNFESLKALDSHIGDNMVDILHDYLFGFVEDDIHLAQAQA
jgi:hypothetical protein